MPDRRATPIVGSAAVMCATAALLASSGPLVAAMAALGAALAAAAFVVTTAFAAAAWRHGRLARVLRACSEPVELCGTAVRLGNVAGAAFVAGLRHPEIYLDRALSATLSAAELRGVALHERAHQLARDPLRLALLGAAAPVVRAMPGGSSFLERLAAQREIAADRYALAHGASRSALASALLRVGPALQTAPGFTSAVDLRVRALLGHDQPVPAARWRWLAAASALGLAACASVMPLVHALTTTRV